jgi:hypothetical protein
MMSAAPARVRVAGAGLVLVAVAVVAAILLLDPFAPEPDSGGPRPGAGAGPGPEPATPPAGGTAQSSRPLPNPGARRVVGYVRDVNGNPVRAARMRIAGARHGTRTGANGRYAVRLPRRARALVAERPGYATQVVGLSAGAVRGHRVDFALAATGGARAADPNSADALVFWTGCAELAAMTRAELDRLIGIGVDGFVCMVGRLHTMGGSHRFSGNLDAQGAAFALQRRLARSPLAELAAGGRLRVYLGFKAADYYNARTPFKEWFDDRAWSRDVIGPVRDLAAAARSLGFAGLALDQELYPGSGGSTAASWDWDYPGGNRPERSVRAQVERHGSQLMTAMLAGYPGLELMAYDTVVPGAWADKVQEVVNGEVGEFDRDVRVDLWAGLSSVPGYTAIRWLDAIFYKTPHVGRDWSLALRANANATYSLLSRRFPNWSYASSRLHVTPFSWIDEGPSESPFDDARDPDQVADQLAAFRAWGAGRVFGNYAYRGPLGFDYAPYAEAMRTASTPGNVDQQAPELSVNAPAGGGARLDLEGTAHDNFAIRVVRWYDDRDRSGTAQLDWRSEDVLDPDSDWVMAWRIRGIPLSRGLNRITVVAEDIKGLATERQLTVRR